MSFHICVYVYMLARMRVSRLCVTVTLASVSASACTQSARLKTHKFCVCTSLTRGRRPSPPRERYPSKKWSARMQSTYVRHDSAHYLRPRRSPTLMSGRSMLSKQETKSVRFDRAQCFVKLSVNFDRSQQSQKVRWVSTDTEMTLYDQYIKMLADERT